MAINENYGIGMQILELSRIWITREDEMYEKVLRGNLHDSPDRG